MVAKNTNTASENEQLKDDANLHIVIAEMQTGEREYIAKQFPTAHYLDCTLEKCPPEQYADAEILSVFIHSQVTRALLDRMPRLCCIATRSTGYDHIDLTACNERGISVSNVPHYGENTVAEHTFGLILVLSRKIYKAYLRTVAGDFSLSGLEGFDLKGKTLGVVGAGGIGLRVIRIAKGFGMQVVVFDANPNALIAEVLDFKYVSLDALLATADVITLHVPYLPSTHHLINAETIKLIKRGAVLINTARGALVDTKALIDALDAGIIAGAGLDVIEDEELMSEDERLLLAPEASEQLRMVMQQHILLRRPDVIITPHMAFFSVEAHERIMDNTVTNIRAFLAGHPVNVVNTPTKK